MTSLKFIEAPIINSIHSRSSLTFQSSVKFIEVLRSGESGNLSRFGVPGLTLREEKVAAIMSASIFVARLSRVV
jgi:hypothetical protein